MTHILAATDLAPRSDPALARAAILARDLDAELSVVHVAEDGEPPPPADISGQVEAALARAAIAAAPKLRIDCLAGDPAEQIVALAGETDVDLIVMGAHDKRLRRIFAGTTVERVMRAGRWPVLMANAPVARSYERIMLPVDMSAATLAAVEVAHRLGLLDASDIYVVHAFEALAKATMHYAGAESDAIDRHVSASAQAARRELTDFISGSRLAAMEFELILDEGPPYLVIKKASEHVRPDLIVIGTHGRSGIRRAVLGSVAEDVLRRSDCDVLTIPQADGR